MLHRRHRLLTPEDFRLVFRRGKKRPIPGGLIVIFRRDDGGPMRWGFVVPKSVGPAVVRNTVKRRLRSAAAELMPGGPVADIVVRANQDAPQMSLERWVTVLGEALVGRPPR